MFYTEHRYSIIPSRRALNESRSVHYPSYSQGLLIKKIRNGKPDTLSCRCQNLCNVLFRSALADNNQKLHLLLPVEKIYYNLRHNRAYDLHFINTVVRQHSIVFSACLLTPPPPPSNQKKIYMSLVPWTLLF